MIERTSRAVDGLSVDEDKLFDAVPEIHKALADGEVSALPSRRTIRFRANCRRRRGLFTSLSSKKEMVWFKSIRLTRVLRSTINICSMLR